MQIEYHVDPELRESLINAMKKKQKNAMLPWSILQFIGWCLLIAVVLTAIVWLMPVGIESIKSGYFGEALLTLVALIPVLSVTAIIWLVILFFRTHKEKKYLRPWVSYSNEHLWLHRRSMEWGHYNRFKGKFYWVLQMKYEDINRIEYDEGQQLLRIYGPYSGMKWDSIQRIRCHDSFDAYTDAKPDEHFVFCHYYEDFDGLLRDLETASGKTVIRKNLPMKF